MITQDALSMLPCLMPRNSGSRKSILVSFHQSKAAETPKYILCKYRVNRLVFEDDNMRNALPKVGDGLMITQVALSILQCLKLRSSGSKNSILVLFSPS